MVTKIMEWVSITAFLLVVSWRPVASYLIPLDFVVCVGFVMGVLALFFIKREIETHYEVDNRSNPARRVTASVSVLSANENAVETLMPDTIKTGTILIKDGTLLPESLRFESEPCVPGWRLVTDLDGYGLDRKIREAGWTFFCLAGQLGEIGRASCRERV